MYKVSSDKRQRSLHHGKLTDWVNGQEQLSPADQLEQMKEGMRIMHTRVAAATGRERRDLIIDQTRMEKEIADFRTKHGLARAQIPELPQYFVNCAKEILSPWQFEVIMNAAKRDCERASKRKR